MNLIKEILHDLRPIPGFRIEIKNAPHATLVIEDTCREGPTGLRMLSVSHFVENRFSPEILFEIKTVRGSMELDPFYLRDEDIPHEGMSVFRHNGCLITVSSLQREHREFAAKWNAQLEQQGFRQAFKAQLTRLLQEQYANREKAPASTEAALPLTQVRSSPQKNTWIF